MDPQSLDAAVQSTLSGLYPPFDVTAPTVLSQLFRVLDAKYNGDGLCCLLDFLIPSKRLLEHVRQAACAPYSSCVFLHEGWPLCLHEKVVVHLGPLNPLLLRPGDFYLQAEPCGDQSACLTVKCLSRDLNTVEKMPVPEASCSLLFTKEWLEDINEDLDRPMLQTCLVATQNGIVPLPWSKIASPEFVRLSKPEGVAEQGAPTSLESDRRSKAQMHRSSSLDGGLPSITDKCPRPTQGKYPGLIKVEQGSWKRSTLFAVPSLCDIISQNLEGEYVKLLEFSEEGGVPSPPKSKASADQPSGREAKTRIQKSLVWVNGDVATTDSWSCGKGSGSEEGPCTPCLRRKLSEDPKVHEPRCRYRESYVAALQNPVAFTSGLMEAILEEMDLSQQALPSDDAGAKPPERSGQAVPRSLSGHPNKEGKAEDGSKPAHARLLKPPAESPAASNKFSFLKGPRQLGSSAGGCSMPEKASKGQEGPRKRTPLVCSPRLGRPKSSAGKGTSQVDVLSELSRPKSMEGATVSPSTTESLLQDSLSPGSAPQEVVLWESLNPELLSSGAVCLPGNTDKLGRPIIQVNTSHSAWQAPWCLAREVTRLLFYLCSMPRKQTNDSGMTVIIDARKEPPSSTLTAALGSIQKASPGSIHAVLLLAEKEAASHLEKLPGVQVELLSSLKALSRHVESGQLPKDLEGSFPFCHGEWVQYFQKLHCFAGDLKRALELLQGTVQEMEKGGPLETLQEVGQQMDRHRKLMQDVLCNTQLVSLQREGGATLARLKKEAARLSFSSDVRNSIDSTLALYNLVEEEVHTLVTKSNSCLEHLEFLLKIRGLEAEFSKLSTWFDEEGESELREVGAAEWSRESTEESYRRFKEFFKEATARYNRGLSLSKEATKVQGSRFPEMGAFEAAKGAFQAKLTVFYMDMEMKGAELETLLDLYRFRDKVIQFHLACERQLQATLGNEPQTAEALQDGENTVQALPGEFSAETFQQMKVQASSMRSKKGLAVWSEASERCREAEQMLGHTMARQKEAQERATRDCGKEGNSLDSAPKPAPKVPAEVLCLDGASVKTGEQGEGERGTENGPVDRSPFYVSPSQEDPFRSTGKGLDGSREACLASCGALLEGGGPEAPGSPHSPTQNTPTTLPAQSSPPNAEEVPGAWEKPLSAEWPCASVPARGPRSRKRETAQYFQLSRHGSFSSEDTDSQNSTEDSLSSSATLPMEKAWGQEKALGIPYLENHVTSSPAAEATQ